MGINSEKIDQSQTKETHWNLVRKETVTEESGVDCSSLVSRTVSYESVSVLDNAAISGYRNSASVIVNTGCRRRLL